MDVVELTAEGLAPADVIAVARGDARVAIGAGAREAMSRSAAVVEALAEPPGSARRSSAKWCAQ